MKLGYAVSKPTPRENGAAAGIETRQGLVEFGAVMVVPVVVLQLLGRIGAEIGKISDGRSVVLVAVVVGLTVERRVKTAHARLHLHHGLRADAEIFGHLVYFVEREPAEACLGAAQIEDK